MKRLVFLAALLCSIGAQAQTYFPARNYAPIIGQATPMQQVFGDLLLIYEPTISGGTLFGQPVNGAPMATANAATCDEGAASLNPVSHKVLQVWGDCGGVVSNGASTCGPSGTSPCRLYFPKASQCTDNGGVSGGTVQCLSIKFATQWPASGGAPADPSPCNAIANYDAALLGGNLTAAIDYTNCPPFIVMTNTAHPVGTPQAAVPTVTGTMGNDAFGAARKIVGGREATGCAFPTISGTPTLGCAWNMTRTAIQPGRLHLTGESDWLTGPVASAIADTGTTDLQFARTVTLSTAPQIPQMTGVSISSGGFTLAPSGGSSFQLWMVGQLCDIADGGVDIGGCSITSVNVSANTATIAAAYTGSTTTTAVVTILPDQDHNTGKFMETAPVVRTVAGQPWASKLPGPVQSSAEVMFLYGASYYYRGSSLYLALIDPTLIAGSTYSGGAGVNGSPGGVNNMWYLTGRTAAGDPVWTQGHEELAIPLIDDTEWSHTQSAKSPTIRCIGEHSLTWSPGCNHGQGCFVLGYGSAECGGLRIRTTLQPTPWSKWSPEISLLPNTCGNSSWAGKLLAQPCRTTPDMQVATPAAGYPANASCMFGVCSNQYYDITSTSTLITAGNGGSPYGQIGNPYALNLWPGIEKVLPNGDVQYFGTFTGFDPYNAWQLTFTLRQ